MDLQQNQSVSLKFTRSRFLNLLILGKGKEICDVYCKPFSVGSLEERRKYLVKYNFTCQCGACSQDWPDMNSLSSELDNLPLKQYNQPQNRINNQIKRVQRAEQSYRKLAQRKDASLEEHVTGLTGLLDELHKLVKQPHGLIVYWENILHQALLQQHAAKVAHQGGNTKTVWPC